MKRILTSLLFMLCLVQSPKADVTLSDADFDQIMGYLKQLQALERELPVFKFEGFTVTQDKHGNVFLPSKLNGAMQLGHMHYTFTVPLSATLYKKKDTESFFRSRYKVSGYVSIDYWNNYKQGFGLVYEPMHYKSIGFNILAGTTMSGSLLSFDVFKNMSLGVGAGVRYEDWKVAPMVSIGFALN